MDWGTIVGWVLAGLSIIIGIVLYLKSRRNKEPAWAYRTSKIIGIGTNAPKELKLTFSGKPVNEVYKTTLMFINKGRETIRKEDVTQNIAIYFTGAEILREPTIESVSKQAIEFAVNQIIDAGKHAVKLDFRYLDHNDGGVIEVIHTRSGEVECAGNVMGAKNITYMSKMEEGYPPSGIKLFGFLIPAIVLVAVAALAVFRVLPIVPKYQLLVGAIASGAMGFGLGAIFALFPYTLRYVRFKKFPSWYVGIQGDISRLAVKGFAQEAYCMKCRSKKRIRNPKFFTLKNGKTAVQGVCPDCGTKLFRIGVTAMDDPQVK
jgi:hypothetical protein